MNESKSKITQNNSKLTRIDVKIVQNDYQKE